ncbi:hypothetical protein GF380_00825 [Candidatus Uhrbacteria bacterium]|nr:hypothetical protein [Candidatus Uhrbacteria bacterium]
MSGEEAQVAVQQNGGDCRGVNFERISHFDVLITQDVEEDGRLSAYWQMAKAAWQSSTSARRLGNRALRLIRDAKKVAAMDVANEAFAIVLELGPGGREVELEVGEEAYYDLLVVDGECIPVTFLDWGEGTSGAGYEFIRVAKRISRREHRRENTGATEDEDEIGVLGDRLDALKNEFDQFFPQQVELEPGYWYSA